MLLKNKICLYSFLILLLASVCVTAEETSIGPFSISGLEGWQSKSFLPWLNWRWKVRKPLSPTTETTKSGDDYAARIYVIIDGGMLKWRSKALTYVWSSRSGDIPNWPNAFVPKNAMMMAVRNAASDTETWYTEKRNVLSDLKQAFGKEIRYIDAIAIMTDTDNTGQTATALYGDVIFSEQ